MPLGPYYQKLTSTSCACFNQESFVCKKRKARKQFWCLVGESGNHQHLRQVMACNRWSINTDRARATAACRCGCVGTLRDIRGSVNDRCPVTAVPCTNLPVTAWQELREFPAILKNLDRFLTQCDCSTRLEMGVLAL